MRGFRRFLFTVILLVSLISFFMWMIFQLTIPVSRNYEGVTSNPGDWENGFPYILTQKEKGE